jgi:predicted nucleic-acid-binding protein
MLIAVDTNIMIRLAMRDDESQFQTAMALLAEHQFFISQTVQLEMEWVLRSRYKQSSAEIANFFNLLLQKSRIDCENETELMDAICWYRLGADFADALHLAHTKSCLMSDFAKKPLKRALRFVVR